MKSNNIDYFFSDFLFNRETSSKSSWNQYIDILICNSSHDEWRDSLKSRPEPYRFAKVHKYIEPHPLWSLRLQHPEYTLKLFELINFFLTYESDEVLCKLCKRNINDTVQHFILANHVLYKSREYLMHLIVNSLTINTYVKLTYKSDNIIVGTILGSKDSDIFPEKEWVNYILSVPEGITVMIKDMRKPL